MSNLNLSWNSFKYILYLLAYNNTIKVLKLSNNTFSTKFEDFSEDYQFINKSLEEVDVSNCCLNYDGFVFIFKVFNRKFRLKCLKFNDNVIGDIDSVSGIQMENLNRENSLISLSFTGTRPSLEFLTNLLNMSSNLLELDLSYCDLSLEANYELSYFLNGCKLTKFNLSHNKFLSESIDILCEPLFNSSIIDLNLSSNTFSHLGMFKLVEHILNHNSFKIKVLNLSDIYLNTFDKSEVGIKSASDLISSKNASSIEELDLSNNMINNTGAFYISEALKVNDTLKVLKLSNNVIDEQGARYIAEGLKVNKTLVNLELNKCGSREHTIFQLDNKRDDISDQNCLNSNTMIASILKLARNIKSFSLAENNFHSYAALGISQALNNSKCSYLDLSSNKLTSIGISALESYLSTSNLLYLDLSNNGIGVEGCKALFDTLKQNKKDCLKTLILNKNNIATEGLNYACSYLVSSKSVINFHATGNNITNEGLETLLYSIVKNDIIEQIDLSNNELDNLCITHIVKYFSQNSSLLRLNVKENIFTPEIVNYLSEYLPIYITLSRLDIDFTVE